MGGAAAMIGLISLTAMIKLEISEKICDSRFE